MKVLIGVMGAGNAARPEDVTVAYELGKRIAGEGWVTLTGGRNAGVMDAASRGARDAGGLVVGILPLKEPSDVSEAVDIRILTGMGSARNAINIHSSNAIIACGMGAGTASEVALALKAGKHVILLNGTPESNAFFRQIGGDKVHCADSADAAITLVKQQLG